MQPWNCESLSYDALSKHLVGPLFLKRPGLVSTTGHCGVNILLEQDHKVDKACGPA